MVGGIVTGGAVVGASVIPLTALSFHWIFFNHVLIVVSLKIKIFDVDTMRSLD